MPESRLAEAAGEDSALYPGWRVAIAASGCVFVSFASLLVYTFGVFLKPVARGIWLVPRGSLRRLRDRGPRRGGVLTSARLAPLLVSRKASHPAVDGGLRLRLRFAVLADAPFVAPHAVFLVLGMVGNGTAHLAYSRALATWFHERRGMAFAALMTGGAMVLPPAAEALIGAVGWRVFSRRSARWSWRSGCRLASRCGSPPSRRDREALSRPADRSGMGYVPAFSGSSSRYCSAVLSARMARSRTSQPC